MKRFIIPFFLLAFWSLLASNASGQKDWSIINDDGWIQIYGCTVPNSSYKRIKVECTLDGTIDKLLSILVDVNNYKDWIYNTKNAYLIKKMNAYEYYYYTETFLPWPMQNRDAVVHIKIVKDAKGLNIVAVGEPDYLPVLSGKTRVPRSSNTWQVTVPSPNKLHITYVFEADPGGHLSPWLVNTFVNKGPYESFKKLAEQLKK